MRSSDTAFRLPASRVGVLALLASLLPVTHAGSPSGAARRVPVAGGVTAAVRHASSAPRQTVPAVCGDSLLDAGEQCDDGNAAAGDGCSSTCQIEPNWSCTAPVPAAVLSATADASFEDGTPNASWAENSTNFGTPLCTEADCGTGLGSGPRAGMWFAWFGGALVYEQSSLQQNVVIPPSATTLSFYIELPVCDSAMDYVRASIDGTQVFRAQGDNSHCGESVYRNVNLDLATAPGGPYNDGASHNLRLGSETFAQNGGVTNFFIDDVVIQTGTTPAQPSVCTYGPLSCFAEDFDPPVAGDLGRLGWTRFHTGALAYDWSTTDTGACGSNHGFPGNFTGGDGAAACIDSDVAGPGSVHSYLCSPPFDLSDAVAPTLGFLYSYQLYDPSGEDLFAARVGTAPPGTGTIGSYGTVLSTSAAAGDLYGLPGASASIDLSAFAGQPQVYLCFEYGASYDYYAQVDDIAVHAAHCSDVDGDGVDDHADNCVYDANADQRDTDGDGIGNMCDADFDQSCVVNFNDLALMKSAFFLPDTTDTDMDGDGQTNFADLGLLKGDFFAPPGPSGITNICSAQ